MKSSKRAESGKKNKTSVISAVCIIIASAALYFAAARIPGFADWYTVSIYPVLVSSLGRLCGMVPLSVAELLLGLLPVIILIDIIKNRHRLRNVIVHVPVFLSVLLLLYTSCCGINYYRTGFVDQTVYEEAVFTEDELAGFCGYIVERLEESELYDVRYPEDDHLADVARSSMTRLAQIHPELKGFYPDLKQLTFLSRAFSAMGISGIYSPFTIEANINGDMPDMEKPFSACHELSHLRGFMNEGEANYIGWLACIGSEDLSFNRSGWLIAWSYAGSALYRTDPERFTEIYRKLPERAIGELEENHVFWTTHETKASEIQDQVNDAYLKSNGQKDGVASYGYLTTLMLKWYIDND